MCAAGLGSVGEPGVNPDLKTVLKLRAQWAKHDRYQLLTALHVEMRAAAWAAVTLGLTYQDAAMVAAGLVDEMEGDECRSEGGEACRSAILSCLYKKGDE